MAQLHLARKIKATTDSDFIRQWAEERGGMPVSVKGGGEPESSVPVLRLEFLDDEEDEDGLEAITWEEFFEAFERQQLAFLYEEETSAGELSRFFRLVHRGSLIWE